MKTKLLTITVVIFFITSGLYAVPVDKYFYESGQILPGEEWNEVYIYGDDTVVDMFGGTVQHYIFSYDASTLSMTAGNVMEIGAFDNSIANVSGGVLWGIKAWDYGTVNFGNSETKILRAWSFGTINMTGGVTEFLSAGDSATVNLYGGLVTDSLSVGNLSIGNIFGHDLFISSGGGSYGHGYVSGFWDSGLPFNICFLGPETYAHVNLIPEPNSLILLSFGGLLLRRKR